MLGNKGTRAEVRLILDSLLPLHHLEGALEDVRRIYCVFHEQDIALPRIEFRKPSFWDRRCGFFSVHEQNGQTVRSAVEFVVSGTVTAWKASVTLQKAKGKTSGQICLFRNPETDLWQEEICGRGRLDRWVARHGGKGCQGISRIGLFDIELEAAVRLMAQELLDPSS